jgi:lactoylglutathione lyase
MKLIRLRDYPSGKFTLAFVGFGDEAQNTVIELTYNWEIHQYDRSNAFGHLALGVETSIKPATTYGEKAQILFLNPGPMKHGGTEIAFIEDPNGYKIELIDLSRRGQA